MHTSTHPPWRQPQTTAQQRRDTQHDDGDTPQPDIGSSKSHLAPPITRRGAPNHLRRHHRPAHQQRTIVVTSSGPDPHLADIRLVTPQSTAGCQECLELGTTWVHLRMCLTCGHIGCCDSSPMRHASLHAQSCGHAIVQSAEPGETWRWSATQFHTVGPGSVPQPAAQRRSRIRQDGKHRFDINWLRWAQHPPAQRQRREDIGCVHQILRLRSKLSARYRLANDIARGTDERLGHVVMNRACPDRSSRCARSRA
jgi:Zn-finger in ubiquitin-hydrolases and other protein